MCETEADFETLVEDILAGQYYSPRRIVAFNTEQGWARDVTEDVAREVLTRARSGSAAAVGSAGGSLKRKAPEKASRGRGVMEGSQGIRNAT